VSTPYMDEANRCDRVALIQRGALLAVDTPQNIAASLGQPLFAVTIGGDQASHGGERYRALLALRKLPHTSAVYPFGDTLHYADKRTDRPAEAIAADVQSALAAGGLPAAHVEATAPTVEDAFIARMSAA